MNKTEGFHADRTDDRRCDHRHSGLACRVRLPDLHRPRAGRGRHQHGCGAKVPVVDAFNNDGEPPATEPQPA